jgi:hypothetical protein
MQQERLTSRRRVPPAERQGERRSCVAGTAKIILGRRSQARRKVRLPRAARPSWPVRSRLAAALPRAEHSPAAFRPALLLARRIARSSGAARVYRHARAVRAAPPAAGGPVCVRAVCARRRFGRPRCSRPHSAQPCGWRSPAAAACAIEALRATDAACRPPGAVGCFTLRPPPWAHRARRRRWPPPLAAVTRRGLRPAAPPVPPARPSSACPSRCLANP